MLLTLNQVISQITTLGAAHLQIQSTGVGDFAEWQALERAYPLLWVFHETTSIGDRELVYSIRLVCADRVITGEEGDDTAGMEQEVLSDTLLILLDFLAYFQQQHAQSYKVITNASIDPFTERFNDRVAGNSVLIQIRQPFTWDACQIPQTGATIPPSVDGLTLYDFCDPSVIARLTATQVACLEAEYGITCVDATVTQNGNAFFTVPAGATYPLVTKLDGVNNLGTFNAGTKTLSFTSAACSPVTFQINAVNKESITSGTTFNLITKLDGAVNSGSYDAPTDTLSFTSAACSPVALQINGTPQESIAAGATFNLIATLDGVAGGTYTPATDTLAFTSNSGWVRPSFWPALPTLTAASEAGYILLPVYENRLNRFSLQINNSTVDWGDGTTSAPSGAVRTKTYDYATISATVYVDALTGENYKFVIIGITRTGSPITFVYLAIAAATVPTRNYNYGVDWNFSFPNCTDFFLSSTPSNGSMVSVKQFKLWSSGSAIMVAQYMRGIESLQLPSFPSMSLASAFRFLGGVRIGNVNFGLATSLQQAFYSSNIISFGNITANSITSASEMVSDNYQLESVGTITMTSATNLGYVFANNYVIKSIGLITANSCTILEAFAFNCNALIAIRFANCANVTNTSQMIQNCYSLQVLDMPNLTRGVNFTNTSMGNYGMNIFANGIGTASGAQTITITGTPFGALVTASDATALAIRLVMTGKGFTIAN